MIKLKHSLEIDHHHKTTISSHCPSSTSQGPTNFKRLTSIFIIWLSYVFEFCIDARQSNDKCFFHNLISCNKVANFPHVLYVVNVKGREGQQCMALMAFVPSKLAPNANVTCQNIFNGRSIGIFPEYMDFFS
jgi:hypothetical protein